MYFLLFLTLLSVIPAVYKTEDPLGSCSKNEPFRMDDGNCVNFRHICIKENSQCKSVLNACSQCPPSGYTISMLATLNDKINAITNSSNSTRTIVQLLPTLNDKMNELSTLRKEIKDIKNMSDSTRKHVELLPAFNEKLNELSTLRKEIINLKNMSDSTRKQVELLPDLNVTRNETLTIREEIKDLKNDGICLKILCILSFIGIAFIIGFCIFKIVKHKMTSTSKKENPQTNTQTPNKNGKPRSTNIQNQVFRKQSDSRKSNEVERGPFLNNEQSTSKCIPNKYLEEDNTTKYESEKTPGPYDKVFGKLDETNERLNKILKTLERRDQEMNDQILKTLERRDQEMKNQIISVSTGLSQDMKGIRSILDRMQLGGQTPGPYDKVFGKLDERNEKLNKILKILERRDQEMNNQIKRLENTICKLEKIIEKLNAQKTEQIPSPAVPEGVGGSNTKQRRTSGPEDDQPSSQPITQMVSDIHH